MQESITSNLNKLAVARTAWNCAQRVYIYIAQASFALADVDFYEIVADESSLLEPLTPAICVLSCIRDARRDVSRWLMVVFHRLRSTACRLHLSRRNREKKHHVFSLWILNGRDRERNELFVLFFFFIFFSNVIVDTWTVRLNFGLIIHGRGLISSVILGISNVISYYKYYLQYNFIYGMQFSLIIDRTV